MNGFTYILFLNKSPVFYIGSTSDLQKRKARHLRELKNNIHHNVNLQKSWNESNSTDLKIGIIYSGSIEEAKKREEFEIQSNFENKNMANIGINSTGGDNIRRHPDKNTISIKKRLAALRYYSNLSDEQREKFRQRVIGKNNPMYGKTHTDEVKKRISNFHKGHTYGKGRKLSPEHVAKISERQRLRIGSKNSFYGRKHTKETREKIRLKSLGRKPSTTNIIEIDGVRYSSQADAAKALKVCIGTITFRLQSKNPKFSNYRVIQRGQ